MLGLYKKDPGKALVLCMDEKIKNQALDRMQPGSSIKRGRSCTMPHNYKHNGTASQFAALSILAAKCSWNFITGTSTRNSQIFGSVKSFV